MNAKFLAILAFYWGVFITSLAASSCSAPKSGFDISQDNLKQVNGKQLSECCGICASTSGCGGYAWNDYLGGTCWLKASGGPMIRKDGVSAAVLENGGAKGWRVLKQFDMTSRNAVAKEWDIKVWDAYFVNAELQAYIDSPSTLFERDGVMVIKAFKQGNGYVSARLESKQRFNPVNVGSKKIRYEFTGTVPTVKGAWPAYWVLGDMAKYGQWPKSGEIDLMEWVYQLGDRVLASLHWKGPIDWSTDYLGITRQGISNNYYTWGAEVSAVPNDEYVQFYMKDPNGNVKYGRKAPKTDWDSSFPTCSQTTPGATRCSPLAPFDNDMFLIINLAIGGEWGGCCGVDGDFSQVAGGVEMKIKKVVVYEGA